MARFLDSAALGSRVIPALGGMCPPVAPCEML
ncbi:uncharacterized protein SOCEGT47_024400 [Sorangium cellulosum]|uniref:Uncharacterized protein n=1 Tax=Sorangium cellulosum TaxID=56 RepID=A0A4V0NDA0_SORCE|nr:uncharacterized protein SOCEGT47_024400 [Sorangium cellulosum]